MKALLPPRHAARPARIALPVALVLGVSAAGLSAQEKPTVEPASASSAEEARPLQALVLDLKRDAWWSPPGKEKDFRKISKEMVERGLLLDPGTVLRTGRRSHLTLRVGANAVVQLLSITKLELRTVELDGDVLRTRVLITDGEARIAVDPQADPRIIKAEKDDPRTYARADFIAATPSSMNVGRGTGLWVSWGAFEGARVRGYDGNDLRAIEARYFTRRVRALLSAAAVSSERHPDPVQNALYRTVFPPSPAFTQDELQDQVDYGFLIFRDQGNLSRIESGGSDFGEIDRRRGFVVPPPGDGRPDPSDRPGTPRR